MNQIKKVLAIMLVLVVAVTMAAPAFASVTDEKAYSLDFSVYDAVSDGKYIYASGSSTQYRVYRIDIESGEMASIGFSNRAESLYLHEGKLFVALCDREHNSDWWEEAQTGAFAIIDCASFTLEREVCVDIDPFDIVVSNSGVVYIASGSGQWTNLKAYTQDGSIIDICWGMRHASTIEYNPVLDRIYTITSDVSPRNMSAYPLNADGSFANYYDWQYHGAFESAVNFYITPDGGRIFNGYGYTLGLSRGSAFDMLKQEDLDLSFRDMEFDVKRGLAYFAADTGLVYAYDYESLTPVSVFIPSSGMPEFVFVCDGGIALITSNNNKFYFETVSEDSTATTLSYTYDAVRNYVAQNNHFYVDASNYADVVIIVPLSALGDSSFYVDAAGGKLSFHKETIKYLRSEYGNFLFLYMSGPGLNVTEVISDNLIIDDPNAPYYIEIPYRLEPGQDSLSVSITNDDYRGVHKIPNSGYDNGIVKGRVTGSGSFEVSYDPKTYNDISGHWGEKYINFTSARDLFSGVGEGKFAPDVTMSRAMFVTVLSRIAHIDESEYTWTYFTDVDSDSWYGPAVSWALQTGLVNGIGGNLFAPDAPVTREQMAKLISLFMEYSLAWPATVDSAASFADEHSISDWAYYHVKEIQGYGLISGRPGNIFDPQGSATRAEVAAILTRYFGGLINISV